MSCAESEQQLCSRQRVPASGAYSPDQERRIKVFVAMAHPMCRIGLGAMLSAEPALQWVGEAASVSDAVRIAPGQCPDVVLLDEHLPGMDPNKALVALKTALPRARYVVLLEASDAGLSHRVIAAGAGCVLLESATLGEISQAIRAADRGQRLHSNGVYESLELNRHSPGASLTQRERALLQLMAQGLDNKGIGSRLGIALPTVKFHVGNILSKLHSENRTAAVLYALRHRLAVLDPA
jgi:NarL family two-component system response regulator LiaR